jgi:diguanylate cyclase (GGDEF)-like protein/PAS domain S-box-containing protein
MNNVTTEIARSGKPATEAADADAARRFEGLTDTHLHFISDRQERYLLQRARIGCRESDPVKRAAVLDALEAHIVILDAAGFITSANRAWMQFASSNCLAGIDPAIGRNYLDMCDDLCGQQAHIPGLDAHIPGPDARVPGQETRIPRKAAHGIRSVLRGGADFTLEYPAGAAEERRWFLLIAASVEDERATGAVVMLLDISERKRAESDLRQFAMVMDHLPDAIFLIDRGSMRLTYVNEAACRLHGLPRDEVLGLRPWAVLDVSRAELERHYDSVIADGGTSPPTEKQWHRRHGPPIWLEMRRHAQIVGERRAIVSVVRDITARKEAESRIEYLNRVYAVLSRINGLIVRVRHRDELFREACRLAVDHGKLAAASIAIVDGSLNRVVLAASADLDTGLLEAINRRLSTSSIDSPGASLASRAIGEKRVIVSNHAKEDAAVGFGQKYAACGIHSLAFFPLIVGEVALGVMVLYAKEPGFFHEEEIRLLTELANDVAFAMDHIEKQERLDYLAYYDVLTGLANRSLFLERTEQCLLGAAGGGHKVALCLVDLERFKNINDSLGRPAGDALLRQVAQWLTSHAGGANRVARIDTDRFAVLLPKIADEEDAARYVEHAIELFSGHSFDLSGTGYRIALKVGVASFPGDGEEAEVLFRHAEAALKKAKTGGHRYLFYDQRMTEAVAGRLSLENQLRGALERGEYELHYQPKVELASGRLVGAEALLRWNDPRTGLMAPGRFIPILEETGLIQEVGRWALGRAIGDHLAWRDAGLPTVRVAVNLSPRQLRSRDIVSDLLRAIAVDDDAAAGLELELTENLIMEDIDLSTAALSAIRATGVRIAIDDFGTGFSSLSYLSKLPVDTIKIDRSFVVDMAKGPEGMSLISIIISLAHSLKLKVVAEGVETEEQSRLLRLLGCDEMQGFLVSEPVPASIFADKFLAVSKAREVRSS